MKIIEHSMQDIFVVELVSYIDDRGFFMRTYDDDMFIKQGFEYHWKQENHAMTFKAGVLRGLHFQIPPHAETKLVRCIRGEVLDVFVDMRQNSINFGKWGSIVLNAENKREVLIAKGFAHGYLTLSTNSEVVYKVDASYHPESERGLIWSDPDVGIDWTATNPIVSEKDANNMTFRDYMDNYPQCNW